MKQPPHKRRLRTLDIITASAGDRDRLVVAGEVAEIQFPKKGGLSLLATKLFFQLVEMAGAEICEAKTHTGLMQDLNWSHRDLGFIEDAVLELHRTVVSLVQETSKGKRRLSGSVLAHMDRPEDRKTGEIVWEFSKDVPGRGAQQPPLGGRQHPRNPAHGVQVLALALPAGRAACGP